jgi:hypothetical protein
LHVFCTRFTCNILLLTCFFFFFCFLKSLHTPSKHMVQCWVLLEEDILLLTYFFLLLLVPKFFVYSIRTYGLSLLLQWMSNEDLNLLLGHLKCQAIGNNSSGSLEKSVLFSIWKALLLCSIQPSNFGGASHMLQICVTCPTSELRS